MPHKPTIPRVCQQCGKDFLVEPYKIQRGEAKFCSVRCSAIYCGAQRQAVPRVERFLAKVRKSPNGCWLWTGAKNKGGYGITWDGKQTLLAHRFAYLYFVGSIPSGLDLDHLCRNRGCVNPKHLEPVDRQTNALRGTNPMVLLHHAGKCCRGHDMTPDNTYVYRGKVKGCRACMRERSRQQAERQKARTAS